MNIENAVDSRLWEHVSKAYEERNYSTAILDAIQYLGDSVRDKTGLASDGMSMIGEAFGGMKPKLRVNRFQTETERNVQGGIEHLVRGLYKTFRNPRSHEKITDSQEDANTVILMVNYLLKVIGQAKAPFDKSKFMERVFDRDFVENQKYAELLISEVPVKYVLDILLDVYRNRASGDSRKLAFVVAAFWNRLQDDSRAEFSEAASDDLNTLERDELIPFICIMPAAFWPLCAIAARMRVENMLISSIKAGRYNKEVDKCVDGALGTWATRLMEGALLGQELQNAIAGLLETWSEPIDYAFEYLLPSLPTYFEQPTFSLRHALLKGLEAGDIRFKDSLSFINQRKWNDETFEELDEYEYPKWHAIFSKAMAQFVEKEQDDIPF